VEAVAELVLARGRENVRRLRLHLPVVAAVARFIEADAAGADARRDAEVAHLPGVDRRRLENPVQRAAERGVDQHTRAQHAVVVDGLVVAAVVERAVARRGLLEQRAAPLRTARTG